MYLTVFSYFFFSEYLTCKSGSLIESYIDLNGLINVSMLYSHSQTK